MLSGKDMEEMVDRVIKEEIISKMKTKDLKEIPVSLLEGLYNLVEETN